MQSLAKQAGAVAAKQAKYRKELQELNQELKQAGVSGGHFKQQQAALAAASDKAAAAIKRQQAALDRLDKAQARVQKAAEIRDHAAKVSLVAGGAAFAAGRALSVPVKAYAESESAGMDLRVAMMDKTGKVAAEYAEIDALATKLGDKLPGTTADFKNLMTMLIRQGMSAQTILGGTGEAAALLAVQLKKSPEAAAEMAAKLQDATRGTEREMQGIMDSVQRLFYAGVDDNNILGAFSKMSPVLDILGIKGEAAMRKLGPLVGMLDQSGLSGDSAGNALRKVFDRAMSQDVQKAVAKAKKSGMVGADFSLDFTNGKGEFGGMEKMYQELAKLKGLTTQARGELLKSIFKEDAETTQALNVMIDKGRAGYEEFAAKMAAQASLKQRVNEQLGTLSNLWDAASGTGMNFLAAMGESVSGELKTLVEWIGNINEKLSVWAKENPEAANALMKVAAVVTVAVAVLAGLSAVLAAVVLPLASFHYLLTALKVGQFATQLGSLAKVFAVVKSALSGLTLGLWGFAKAAVVFLFTNPFGWAILAVGALALLWYKWDTVKAALLAGWQVIKNTFRDNPILGFVMGPIGAIGTLIANFDRLKAKAIEVKNAIANSGIGRAVSGAYNTVKNWAGFSRGGYTGAGGVNQAAGIVHKGEVVFSQRDVAKFGGWRMVEAIRRGGAGMLALAADKLGVGAQGRPVLSGVVPVPSGGFARPAAGAVSVGGDTVSIHVHAAPGMSERALADKVVDILNRREAAKRRRANSSFLDRD
ncbi:phage tail tape measure protein [Neisseria wadsworthii]|nr:phage tail tape measure protein [Neisseria wadsworthii]